MVDDAAPAGPFHPLPAGLAVEGVEAELRLAPEAFVVEVPLDRVPQLDQPDPAELDQLEEVAEEPVLAVLLRLLGHAEEVECGVPERAVSGFVPPPLFCRLLSSA